MHATGGRAPTEPTYADPKLERRITQRRDLVRRGPILAGLATTLATLLVLTVLGTAIGLSAFEPDDAGGTVFTTSAAIWGAVSALVAFFAGGALAGRTAAVGRRGRSPARAG